MNMTVKTTRPLETTLDDLLKECEEKSLKIEASGDTGKLFITEVCFLKCFLCGRTSVLSLKTRTIYFLLTSTYRTSNKAQRKKRVQA